MYEATFMIVISFHIFIFSSRGIELNYHDQKIHRTPTHDIREHWTAISTLLGLVSSVYRNGTYVMNIRCTFHTYPYNGYVTLRQRLKPGSHNVQSHPLVDPNKILPLPLNIKLGVMKNFVKAMDGEGNVLAFLQEKFPRISMEKLKTGIFDGTQIKEIMKDPMFDEAPSEAEVSAW